MTPEEKVRECNGIQASRQVPAGDCEALLEYQRKYPWANITPPEIVEPYRTAEQIEEDNRLRLLMADLSGRIAHGDREE
jgi:hypothetical protein